ncbi:radical SAM family heme chaperone HemW [Desulfococcus sp.]|uniref:radical SAM family heme chaperone HemW n=1 Tax=Desulfococcus sp. TaxID=2025834 RepID=UPI00359401F1
MTILSAEPGGIYIHVPFCVRKCAYCDFYSNTDLSLIPSFLDALCREIRRADAPPGLAFDTLYLGGGTPSVLAPDQIGHILEAVRGRFAVRPDPEVTLEANPGTVTPGTLAAFRRMGVNRINIGVQSFSEAGLRFLGRIHTAEEARLAVRWAREAGFENIGLDLIYGLPKQTEGDWIADMAAAAALAPHHLSCYMLTYEAGTPLTRRMAEGRFRPLSEDRVGGLFLTTIRFLAEKGYAQYEVSNFACSAEKRARHNRKYWSFAPYLGFGPSAHSFIPPERRWNIASLEEYLAFSAAGKPAVAGREVLSYAQQIIEVVFLGLRQNDGIRISDFEEGFGLGFEETFGGVLSELRKNGWLKTDDASRCALTPSGMLFLDGITSMFVSMDFPESPPM